MRIAVKIAYDGRAFHGHQRQPDARTVEGEVINAARAAGLFESPSDAFFRSASRTDRGVSAIGNVVAFNTALRPDGVVGALNDKVKDVWAWAFAVVPIDFHPRRAVERWYRYHLFDELPLDRLRRAAALFEGEHDFRSFTTEPPASPSAIRQLDIHQERDVMIVDVRAGSFLRGLIRRIIAAIVAFARGEVELSEINDAIQGTRRHFGVAPAEPLFLMDVTYGFPFEAVLGRKVFDGWQRLAIDSAVRLHWVRAALAMTQENHEASVAPGRNSGNVHYSNRLTTEL